MFDPVPQIGGVRADAAAVEQHLALRAEQGQALQRGQRLHHLAGLRAQLLQGDRGWPGRQQFECHLRSQAHAQVDVICQVGAVRGTVLALMLDGGLKLLDQQPEQHAH